MDYFYGRGRRTADPLTATLHLARSPRNKRSSRVYLEGRYSMDFTERVFHVSPDGGSGTLELALLLVPVLVVLVATVAKLSRLFIARR